VAALSRDGRTATFVRSEFDRAGIEAVGKDLRESFPFRSSLVLWDVSRGRALMDPVQSDDLIGTAAFSDDGNTLMTTGVPTVWAKPGPIAVGGGAFGLWDVRSGRRIATPQLALPKSLADAAPHGPPLGQDAFLAAYGFSPDGHAIIVTEQLAGDGQALFQPIPTGPARVRTRRILWQPADLARLVCERLPVGQRALTADEIRRLLPGERYQPTCAP